MKYSLDIPLADGSIYSHICFFGDRRTIFIFVPDVVVIYLYKHSDFDFSYDMFFYSSKLVFHDEKLRTLSKLYGAVQKHINNLL